MTRKLIRALVATGLTLALHQGVLAQETPPDYLTKVLQRSAEMERHQLVPMRDGVGLSTDIYRPRGAKGPLPTVFIRTPYNFATLAGSELLYAVEAVKRGYALVIQNERGRYFSEGKFQILGYPQTDGYDALSWIAKQPWSNGKVGTLGCSSSAEWQLALATQHHPAHAAMIPMAAGAGIGKVGRFWEQGNWFTGGAQRSLFGVWLYHVDNPLRAQIPSDLDPKIRSRIALYNDLNARKPSVDWPQQIFHLPVAEMLSQLGEPPGTFEELITLKPASPQWRQGGLYQETDRWGVPALWFDSWYDVSIGPNLELFNHIRKTGDDATARANQYAVIGPQTHCAFLDMGPDDKVGARPMGDTSFDTIGTVFAWFDRWLKGDRQAFPDTTPAVRYFTMGENRWESSPQWPPVGAKPMRFYLNSGGKANSLYGDGTLSIAQPSSATPDSFVYDPLNPVQTLGGADCCNGGIIKPGAFDQRQAEARQDVLVYTSEPLAQPLKVSGFVDAVLHVSSSAKDTDFAVKLVDVTADGTAYIIGDTILRARYREGYEKEVFMQPGGVYKLQPTPLTTSLVFGKGHRIRVEITSSNFPKFLRNLNTGGDNVTEKNAVVATNQVHHSKEHPSYIELPVVR
jgi:putative CocE/NonD family hydrolase